MGGGGGSWEGKKGGVMGGRKGPEDTQAGEEGDGRLCDQESLQVCMWEGWGGGHRGIAGFHLFTHYTFHVHSDAPI